MPVTLRRARSLPVWPRPGGREKRMPFRPENIMTTLLLGAVVLVAVVSLLCVTFISIFADNEAQPITLVVGVAGTTLAALVALLRSEADRREARQERQALDKKVEAAKDAAEATKDAAEAAASRTEEAVRKTEEVQQDIKEGVLEQVTETNVKVAELARNTNGEMVKVVLTATEQVRAAEKDQAATDLLRHPDFRAVLEQAAEAAVKRFREGQGRG